MNKSSIKGHREGEVEMERNREKRRWTVRNRKQEGQRGERERIKEQKATILGTTTHIQQAPANNSRGLSH